MVSRIYETEVWRATVPDGWSVRGDSDGTSVTLYRPNGVGTLHILTFDDEFGNRDPDAGFKGRMAGRMWLSGRSRKDFRRSCAAQFAELERDEVDMIVQSIEPRVG